MLSTACCAEFRANRTVTDADKLKRLLADAREGLQRLEAYAPLQSHRKGDWELDYGK